jgi:hypothetical protein
MSEISDEKIKEATGKTWPEWKKIMDGFGASDKPHPEIASTLNKQHGVPGWWCQMLTVRYEQSIGRRKVGQGNDGEFSVGASRTIDGSESEALNWWLKKIEGLDNFNGKTFKGEPFLSETAKHPYWRVNLADGSRVVMGVYPKSSKSSLAVEHSKIKNSKDADSWKIFWKKFISQ